MRANGSAPAGCGLLRRRRRLRHRIQHGCGSGVDGGRHPRQLGTDARHVGRCLDGGGVGGGRRSRRRPGTLGELRRQEGKARVIDLTRPLFGDARDARVSTAAIRLPVLYPTILSGADHDLADLVAASSSPPRDRRTAPPRRPPLHRCRHRHDDVRRPCAPGGPARRRGADGRSRARPPRRRRRADGRLRADAVADDRWAGALHPAQSCRRRAGGHRRRPTCSTRRSPSRPTGPPTSSGRAAPSGSRSGTRGWRMRIAACQSRPGSRPGELGDDLADPAEIRPRGPECTCT